MPTKNKLSDLRNHLFETLEDLRDPQKPGDIKRATAVANVAQAIISTAKLELQYRRMSGQEQGKSDFIDVEKPALPASVTPPLRKGLETGKNLGADPAARPQ